MVNTLSKTFNYVLVQQCSYSVTHPGYSYYVCSTLLIPNPATNTYVISYLKSKGYTVTPLSLNTMEVLYDGAVVSGWYANVGMIPRTSGNAVDGYYTVWDIPPSIDLPVPYAPKHTPGTWVNVPATTELVIPPLINKKVFDKGWNAGANSVNTFLGAGEGSFSISAIS